MTRANPKPVVRSFRPEDLYRFRIATEPRLSPDGTLAVFTVQTVAPTKDGYRHALWAVDTAGGHEPRRLTIGAKHDRGARFSPDGRTLAFLSDRRLQVEEEPTADVKTREDGAAGLPPPAGRRRGAPPHGPAAGSRRIRVVPGRPPAARHEHLAWRDARCGSADSRPDVHAEAGRRAGVRLPLRRPAGLHVQRSGVRLPHDRPAVGRRRRDGRGAAADRRARRRLRRRLVPGRPEASSTPRTCAGTTTSRPGRTSSSSTSRAGERTRLTGDAGDPRRADMAARRLDGRRDRRLSPRQLLSERRLADRGRRLGCPIAAGRPQPHRRPRPDADSTMTSDIVPNEPARLIPSADGRWLTFLAPRDGSMEL